MVVVVPIILGYHLNTIKGQNEWLSGPWQIVATSLFITSWWWMGGLVGEWWWWLVGLMGGLNNSGLSPKHYQRPKLGSGNSYMVATVLYIISLLYRNTSQLQTDLHARRSKLKTSKMHFWACHTKLQNISKLRGAQWTLPHFGGHYSTCKFHNIKKCW